jgi:DnaK suppressor protein
MKSLSLAEAGALAASPLRAVGPDAVASEPADAGDTGRRWRFALESLWERKLDEVIALSKACNGVSDADDGPDAVASLPSLGLHHRASRAYEELTGIAEAIERIDAGIYGLCEGCGQPMSHDWLAHYPQIRCCDGCSLLSPRPEPSAARLEASASGECRSSCGTTWPA